MFPLHCTELNIKPANQIKIIEENTDIKYNTIFVIQHFLKWEILTDTVKMCIV